MQKGKVKTIEKVAIVLGVIIIPLMYSFFYLQAFWDPYAKLSDVPVAVVNLDSGGTMQGEERNLGNEICDKLKNESDIGFVFTDEKDAKEGVMNRKYYASITVPKDFTEKISTVEGSKEKLHSSIKYEANQKKNYLAAQILENAMPKIKESVNESIDKEIVDTLSGKLESVPGRLGELQGGLELLSDGAGTLDDGAAELDAGAKKLLAGAADLNSGADKTAKGSKTLAKGAKTLAEGINTLNGSVGALKDGAQAIGDGATKLGTGAAAVNSGAKKLNAGASALNQFTGGVSSASKGAAELNKGIKKASEGVDQMAAAVANSTSQLPGNESLDAVKKGTENLTSAVKGMQQLMTAYQATGDPTYIEQMNAALKSINPADMDNLNKGVSGLTEGMKSVKTNTSTLAGGLKQLQNGFGSESEKGTLIYGAAALEKGLATLDNNFGTFSSGIKDVTDGAAALTDGSASVVAGANTFAGAAGSMDQLTEGVVSLNNGAIKLSKGANTLADGNSRVAAGSKTLKNAIATLGGGTSALADGASRINEGINTAKEGVDGSVAESKEEIKSLNGLAEYAEEPVSTDTQYIQPVANYGSAFAPYFMGLSLWVGCLMIFFGIYLDYNRKLKSLSRGSDRHFLMIGAFGLIGVAQGICLALVIKYALGIAVNNMGLLLGGCILTSLTFMLIIQFFIVNTGNPGKFVVLLLLILQLTSSAGTFPIETQSQFFIFLNKVLPMTYSTQLFKEAISGTAGSWAAYNAGILVLFMAVFAALNIAGILMTKAKEKKAIAAVQ